MSSVIVNDYGISVEKLLMKPPGLMNNLTMYS